jgi:hypothetical protein
MTNQRPIIERHVAESEEDKPVERPALARQCPMEPSGLSWIGPEGSVRGHHIHLWIRVVLVVVDTYGALVPCSLISCSTSKSARALQRI